MGKYVRLCNKAKFFYEKNNTPLQSVMKCGLLLPVLGRNYKCGRKGTPLSSKHPVKETDKHSFSE
jgi:hypothetical protein